MWLRNSYKDLLRRQARDIQTTQALYPGSPKSSEIVVPASDCELAFQIVSKYCVEDCTRH